MTTKNIIRQNPLFSSDEAPNTLFANVAFNIPVAENYTYSIPPDIADAVAPGMLVRAPFRDRAAIGCVIQISEKAPDFDPALVRSIIAVVSPEYRIDPELMQLAEFIASYYFCSLGEALAAISVVGFHDVRMHRALLFRLSTNWHDLSTLLKKNQLEACEKLEAKGFPLLARTSLAQAAGCSPSTIDRLISAGVVVEDLPSFESVEMSVESFAGHLEPTPEQQFALKEISKAFRAEEFIAFLVHGITGSGKTEVYLQAMAEALLLGKTALCLVPEISLTPQTVERFEKRFRQEIGVFHSQMTRRAKLELFLKIRAGAVRVVIGARSAVFAPLPRLGIIVIDEEHDGSYKQSETPRYHARDVAVLRAKRLSIPVILGSATPSIESYYNAKNGKYQLFKLAERAAGAELPPVRVVDLAREAVEHASASLFSKPLVDEVRKRLKRNEQTILFLNRRGFSNFLFCPSCKWVARCQEDDVALTVHRRGASDGGDQALDMFMPDIKLEAFHLRCHFCGMKVDAPTKCPECKKDDLLTVGAGTQRVGQELAAEFPGARLLRIDYDTISGRDAFIHAWKQMVEGEADIILGTQMIAKGLHLENVTLVGVVLADVGLFIPDFRAEERTFQLLTQVSGRAGRVSAGEVIFQTYMPNHSAIRHATRHDYEGFYAEEEKRRRQWGFPPHRKLIALTISDEDRDRAFKSARLLSYLLSRARASIRNYQISINGPTIAPMARLGGRFRYRVLLRGPAASVLARLLRAALAHPEWQHKSSTRVAIDVDPVDLL